MCLREEKKKERKKEKEKKNARKVSITLSYTALSSNSILFVALFVYFLLYLYYECTTLSISFFFGV